LHVVRVAVVRVDRCDPPSWGHGERLTRQRLHLWMNDPSISLNDDDVDRCRFAFGFRVRTSSVAVREWKGFGVGRRSGVWVGHRVMGTRWVVEEEEEEDAVGWESGVMDAFEELAGDGL
jgi:hypothetical protein